MKRRLKFLLNAGLLMGVLSLLGTGCEELKSERRMVKRNVTLYQVNLSKGDFKAASKFHGKGFAWYSPKGKYKGRNPTVAFLKSIEKSPERSDVYIDVEDITEIKKGEYVVKATFRVRGHTSSSVTTTRWDASMTWVRKGDKWYCIEHKELTDRQRKRT